MTRRNDEVTAESVADFLARYYRPERYTGRGEDYASGLLARYESEFASEGYVVISRHDSITRKTVSYYGHCRLVDTVKFGDLVTIITPHGSKRAGRAVMRSRAVDGRVINLGGRHGTPAIATHRNIVRVKK